MYIKTIILAVSTFAALMAVNNVVVAEDGVLQMSRNHVRVLRLDRPVSKVVIGNSEIADVTVADPTTIVLTGKGYGSTNLVLLDADGNAIADERIFVSLDDENTVRIFRKTHKDIMFCSPNCEYPDAMQPQY